MSTALDETYVRLVDTLCTLDESTNGNPSVPPSGRPQAIAGLERILIDNRALNEHIRHLQQRFAMNLRHQDVLSDEQVERALHEGVEVLSNNELACLLLNAFALRDLAIRIQTVVPDYWLRLMSQHGLFMNRTEGRGKTTRRLVAPTPEQVAEEKFRLAAEEARGNKTQRLAAPTPEQVADEAAAAPEAPEQPAPPSPAAKEPERAPSSQRAWALHLAQGSVDHVPQALRDGDLIVGWSKALGLLDPSLDWPRFRRIVHDWYFPADEDQRRAGRVAGNLWRFIREMQVGDLFVVPHRDEFYVGRVEGPARHEPAKVEEDSAHRRKVVWLNDGKPINRRVAGPALQSRMTAQGACVEATGLLEEIKALTQGRQGAGPTFAAGFQAAVVRQALAELRGGKLDNRGLEELVRDLMKGLGATEARVVVRSPDEGATIIATFPVAGLFEFTVALQARQSPPEASVQPNVLDRLLDGMEAESADLGVFVTTGAFAPDTEAKAARLRDECRPIELVDGPHLAALLARVGV